MMNSVVYILLLVVISLFICWYLQFYAKRRRLYELAAEMNGPPTLPILGNITKCSINLAELPKEVVRQLDRYKSPTRFWLGPRLVLHVWDPKQLEIILNSPHCFEREPYFYDLFKDVYGQSVITLPGDAWRRHRRWIAPVFNKKNIDGFFEVFCNHSRNLVADLASEVGQGVFDVEKYAAKSAIEAVTDTVLNFDGTKDNPNNPLIAHWLDELQETVVQRLTNTWLFFDFFFKRSSVAKNFYKVKSQLHSHLDMVVQEWRKEILMKHKSNLEESEQKDTEKPVKFVEHLLSLSEENGTFTDEELRDEVITVILTGMETTVIGIGYALIAIGMHPEIQEKLYQQIMQVVGPTRQLRYEDLQELKYVDQIINETLRAFPPGLGVSRRCHQEVPLGEYTIPAGTTIVIGMLAAHKDAKTWPNPTKFDPDRFLPEEMAKRNPYSFIAFSGGSRNCVGLRYAQFFLKIYIINLIRSYKIATPYKTVESVDITWKTLLKPTQGFKISLELRKA